MKTIEVKTSELEGAALDWAVAKAIKWIEPLFGIGAIRYIEADRYLMMETPDPDDPEDITKPSHFNHYEQWSPSRIWSQGGPMIEKYGIRVSKDIAPDMGGKDWRADVMGRYNGLPKATSPLIALCRAVVIHELGDAVQVPEDLIGGAA